MIISDLNYLESVSEVSSIVGGRGSRTSASSRFENRVTVRQTARAQAQVVGGNGNAIAVPVNISALLNVINQSGNAASQGGDG